MTSKARAMMSLSCVGFFRFSLCGHNPMRRDAASSPPRPHRLSGGSILRVLLVVALVWSADAVAEPPSDLADLRALALDLVNEDRRRSDLPPLRPDEALATAAQRHAEDMLARGYLAHDSPEGDTVLDRFVAVGGSRWRKVAENIGRCIRCGSIPTAEDVRNFHEGWMGSETHRANVLDPDLRSFGFGIAAADGSQYAVQTFSGPGGLPVLGGEEDGRLLPPARRTEAALGLINRERRDEGTPPLMANAPLVQAAEALLRRLSDTAGQAISAQVSGDALFDALPEGQRQSWRELAVVVGVCGGCGLRPTEADLRFFLGRWMENPEYRARLLDARFTHLGFALAADGQGRKTALAVFGRRD